MKPQQKTSRRAKLIVLVLLVIAAAIVLRPSQVAERPSVAGEPPYLTIFLIDGLTQDAFLKAREGGSVPQLEKLISEGTLIENGIAAFPSMTGYGYYPFITGRDATTSHVLGLRWLHRHSDTGAIRNYVGRTNVQMNPDFISQPATLYEHVQPQYTSSFNSFADRGVTHRHLNGWDFTMAKYGEQIWLADVLASNRFTEQFAPDFQQAENNVIDAAIRDLERRPKIQWITFTSPDATFHLDGDTPLYHTLVGHVDSLIGRYRQASREAGLEDQRIYALITDHGAAHVTQNLNLEHILGAAGIPIFRDPAVRLWSDSFDDALGEYDPYDGILLVNGNTMNYIYMLHPKTKLWKDRVSTEQLLSYPSRDGHRVNIIERALAEPGVEHIATRNEDGTVSIFGVGGRGTIAMQADGLRYTVEEQDPLGYAAHAQASALLDGSFHSNQAWLEATTTTDYPYGIQRLYSLLSAEHCGDLVVLAPLGWDLASDYEMFVGNYRGGHGGLRADQLRVPYILAGPGLEAGSIITTARAEDVGATLFELLGLNLPEHAEGRSLISPKANSPEPPPEADTQ